LFSLRSFFPDVSIRICDIGASPHEGNLIPYGKLVEDGVATVIGFEPLPEECRKFNEANPKLKCLPYAVGDGKEATLHKFFAPGMASLLQPNRELLSYFVGFDDWLEPRGEARVQTHRLDDLEEVGAVDYLKLDTQGSELTILQNAEKVLRDVLIIHTEVQFLPMYLGQPLFGDIDSFLRSAGFVLHVFGMKNFRFVALPDALSRHAAEADAVYVKDFTKWDAMQIESLKKTALVLHDLYSSYALTTLALKCIDDKINTKFRQRYIALLEKGAKR